MKNTIYVLEGTYRKTSVENQTFQLVKGYQPHPHKEGGFITVTSISSDESAGGGGSVGTESQGSIAVP